MCKHYLVPKPTGDRHLTIMVSDHTINGFNTSKINDGVDMRLQNYLRMSVAKNAVIERETCEQ